jgi:ATP-dependent RNA helicase DHX57
MKREEGRGKRQEGRGRRKEEGGRRREEGGGRKEEGGRRREEGGGKEGGRRREEGGEFTYILDDLEDSGGIPDLAPRVQRLHQPSHCQIREEGPLESSLVLLVHWELVGSDFLEDVAEPAVFFG